LYSAEFAPAAEVLRLQIVGDVLKVAAWPLGFVVLARSDNLTHFLGELGWNALFAASLIALLPIVGLSAGGLSFALAYLAYLVWIHAIVRRRTPFRATPRLLWHLGATVCCVAGVVATSYLGEGPALGLGIAATLAFGIHSARELAAMVELGGWLGRLIGRLRRRRRR
jgi:PST family polysaccharide transporter